MLCKASLLFLGKPWENITFVQNCSIKYFFKKKKTNMDIASLKAWET